MDPNTGHLVRLVDGLAPDGRTLEELEADGYLELPPDLNVVAQELLAEESEMRVDLSAPSLLSQWAADHRRHEKKKKARRRRRNRAEHEAKARHRRGK